MATLRWHNITAGALAAPFKQPLLFVKCAFWPILFHLAIFGSSRLDLAPNAAPEPAGPLSPAQNMLLVLPGLIFQWNWMSAHWNETSQGIFKRMFTSAFCRFMLLFTLVGIATDLALSAPGFVSTSLEKMLDGSNPLIEFLFSILGLIAFVTLCCLLIRLTPWRAAVVARHQIVGPSLPIALTKGHAWRILLIRFLVGIGPSILFVVFALRPYAEHHQMSGIRLILFTLICFYWLGADSVACLRIYRSLVPEK
jgi:hypothetical protein